MAKSLRQRSTKNIKLIEASSELGAGKRGSSLGPIAVKMADLNKGRRKITTFPAVWVDEKNEMMAKASPMTYAKYLDWIADAQERLAIEVENAISEEYFPLVLSGDHSNGVGCVSGVKNHYKDKRIGVIWIDAHADIHSPLTTPSGNVHGMPVAALMGINNEKQAVNEVDNNTMIHWERLKTIGTNRISPKIVAADIVYIDIRDLERQEWDIIADEEIEFYTPQEVKSMGVEAIAKEVLEYLDHCDYLWVSFDVDSLDPSISVGTGTPYPDGLTLPEAKSLLHHLLKNPKAIGLEVTEINPLLDRENAMAKAVVEILEEVL